MIVLLASGVKYGHALPNGLNIPEVTVVPGLQQAQREKYIVLPCGRMGVSPQILPLQCVCIGGVALAATPFEVTTMAGRRLRTTVQSALKAFDISEVALCGLTNAYCGYLTTQQEYAAQHYEGASTHFGPVQLMATQLHMQQLASAMVDGCTAAAGPSPPRLEHKLQAKLNWQTGVVYDGVQLGSRFGDLIKDSAGGGCGALVVPQGAACDWWWLMVLRVSGGE